MMIKDMEGKRWEELFLIKLKEILKEKEEIQSIVSQLEDINFKFTLHDLEDYIKSIDENIHIPRWNKYPETNPGQLDVYAQTYYVFFEPDFLFEARWVNGNFMTFNEHRESGNDWEIETSMKFWIPISYPTPY